MTPVFRDENGHEYALSPRTAQMVRVVVALAPRMRAWRCGKLLLHVRKDSVAAELVEVLGPETFGGPGFNVGGGAA